MILYQKALFAKISVFWLPLPKIKQNKRKVVQVYLLQFFLLCSYGITTDWFECVTDDRATIYRQPYSLSSPSIWLRRSIASRPKESWLFCADDTVLVAEILN